VYPNLYRNRNASSVDSLMHFGFSCSDGWYGIINRLSAQLESMILDIPEGQRADYCAEQVKEKFGALCFYMTKYDNKGKMVNTIDTAVGESVRTCELCGAPGNLNRDRPWVRTLCSDCAKARK
jgi:hypothetical protein